MLSFTVIDSNGEYHEYSFETIDDLSREYWSDKIDMHVPANDDAITECEINGVPLYFSTFSELIKAFGIDNEKHFWAMKASAL